MKIKQLSKRDDSIGEIVVPERKDKLTKPVEPTTDNCELRG